ncbi:MAG: hypothetical protein ACR2RB_16250 [Gammaproteobacteria bacterium]
MTINETKREVQALYRDWPDRGQESLDGLAFYGWLRDTAPDVFREGKFGAERTPYQVIKSWIADWEKLHVV